MILSNHQIQMLCSADDCLYFQIDETSYCLSPWSMGLEYSVLVGEKWLPMRGDPGLQLLHKMKQRFIKSSSFDKVIESIPDTIRTKAIQFRHLQHTILRLMGRTKAAVDLVESNPILLWVIAGRVSTNELSYRQAEKLICGKQKIALKSLFPNNNALTVGFIKRIQAVDYNDKEFRLVNYLLKTDTLIDSLRHCKQVNLEVFNCFRSQRPSAFKIPLIKRLIAEESVETPLCYQIHMMTLRALRAARAIQHGNPMEALCRCTSYRHLSSLCGRWWREKRRLRALHRFSETSLLKYIPPIARGTEQIKPITSLRGLYTEGQKMHHCAFQEYAEEVYGGKVSIYQVLAPKRGTLALANDDDEYEIQEFKLAANDDPPNKAWDTVRAWVHNLNQTIHQR